MVLAKRQKKQPLVANLNDDLARYETGRPWRD
jgi:hypothetical protein